MCTHDIDGRAYATVAATVAGTIVEVDGDFTCMSKGEQKTVHVDDGGLYINCDEGEHYLDGQLTDDDTYIGIYFVR